MTQTATATAVRQPGLWDADPEQTRARMELLETLPLRLQTSDLDVMLQLAAEGKTSRSIAWRISLDTLVVDLEVQRHRERQALQYPLTREQTQRVAEEDALPRVDRREMNRLARGTHIPNLQVRQMITAALEADADLSVTTILRNAGYKDTSHGRRQLGFMRISGADRVTQTIRPEDAARVVRALGEDPVDVAGL
jgi:hypothetical protein